MTIDPVWTLEPALLVERIATVIAPSSTVALVKSPERVAQVLDADLGVLLRAKPIGNQWRLRAWVAEPDLDAATTALALEVLGAQRDGYVFEQMMSLDDVLKAHSSSVLRPAALWSFLRRAMERARLSFDSAPIRERIPAMNVESASIASGKVQLFGMWDGYRFEFRVQYGSASLTVNDPHGNSEPLWFAGMYFDSWDPTVDGIVPSWAQIAPVVVSLAARLERAPFVYLFRRLNASGDEAPWESSGQSAEDAFENLLARVGRLRDQGYLVGVEHGGFDPSPLNRDGRRFPVQAPAFKVRQ